MEQKIKARIVLAHADAKTDNSKKALPNELILYDFNKKIGNSDRTEIRLRIGDGTTSISGLPDLVLDNMNFYDSEPEKPELGDVWYNEGKETFYLGTGIKEEGKEKIKLSHVIENVEDGLGKNSIQTTDSSTAGSMCFRFDSTKTHTQNKFYLLMTDDEKKQKTFKEANKKFSMKLDNNFDYAGVATSLEDGILTVQTLTATHNGTPAVPGTAGVGALAITKDSFLFFPGEPDLGTDILGEGAVALGINNKAQSNASFAEGKDTVSAGQYAHAEGRRTNAIGYSSHAEGIDTKAIGQRSHAEGDNTIAEGYGSHAQGQKTEALGKQSHAEGVESIAKGDQSHAEGLKTYTQGQGAHSEGIKTAAVGPGAHAEGRASTEPLDADGKLQTWNKNAGLSIAEGKASHIEGIHNHTGPNAHAAHAEGELTEALGENAHAEGWSTKAIGISSHAQGYNTQAGAKAFSLKQNHDYTSNDSYDIKQKRYYLNSVEGIKKEDEFSIVLKNNYDYLGKITDISTENKYVVVDNYIVPEGEDVISIDSYLLIPSKPDIGDIIIGAGTSATGYETKALSFGAHSEGYNTLAAGKYSHAEGVESKAGYAAHAEGSGTYAKFGSHAEGEKTEALGSYSHAEGQRSKALNLNSHAEGQDTEANGQAAHSEGYKTKANGIGAHAEGQDTIVERITSDGKIEPADGAHAEGYKTTASGNGAHAEGTNTTASGNYSHAEGSSTMSKGPNSHAEGTMTIAKGKSQHVQGKYNIEDTEVTERNPEGKYAHIVGNGTSTKRSNAHTLDWDGNAWFAKGIVLGGSDLENYDGIVPRFRGTYNFLNEINNPEQGDIAFLTNQQVEKIYTGFLISKILNSHADTYINFPIDNEAYPCLINDFYGNLYTKIISYLLGEEIYQEFPLKAPNENKTFDFKEDNLVLSFVFGDYPNIQLNLKVNKVVINSTSPFPGTDYENNYYNGYLKIYGNWDSHDLSIEKISNRLFSDEDVTISFNREIVEDSIPEDLRKYLAFEQKRLHEFYFYADNEWRRMYNTEDGELYVRYPQMNYCGTIDSLPQDEVDIGSVYTLNYQEIKEFDQEVKISNNKIQISDKVYPEIIKYLWTDILQIEENLARNSLKDTTYHFTFPNDKIYLGVNIEDVWYDFNLISLYISYPSPGINAPGLSTITGTFLKNNNIFYFNDSINIDKIKIGKYIDNSRSYKDLFMFDGDIWRKFYYSYNVPKTLLEKGEGKNSLQRIGVSQSIGDYSIDFGVSTKVYNVSSKEEEEIYKDWNNEKFGLILGKNSVNLGTNNLVGGENNIANGTNNFIHGYNNYVEGYNNTVFAETKEGKYIGGTGLEESNHIEGINNTAYVDFESFESVKGMHQEGCNTISSHVSGSHVGGVYNKPDDNNEFIRVIGNGACDSEIYGYSYEDYKADNNSFDNFNDNCKVIQNISRRNNGLTLGLNGELNIDKMITLTDNHYATIYDCGSGEKFPIDVKPGALFALTKEIKNQNEYRGYEIFGNEKLDYLAYTKYTKFSSGNPPSSNTLQMIMNAQTSELSFLIPNKEEFQSSASVYAQELEYLEKSNYNNSSSIEKTILSIIEKQTGINLYGYGADKKVVKLETSFNDDLTFIFKQIPKSQDESIKYWQFKAYGFIYQLYDVTPNIGKNLKGELKLYGDTFYYSENLNSLLNNEDNINWLNSEIKGFGIGDEENSDIYLIDVLNPNGQTYDYNLKLSNIANCTAGTYLLNKDYKWENFGDNITNNLRFQYSKDDIEINSPLSTGTLYIVYDDEE